MVSPKITREIALAQAAHEHGCYFLELGANERAAAYFQFASNRLQIVTRLLISEQVIDATLARNQLCTLQDAEGGAQISTLRDL